MQLHRWVLLLIVITLATILLPGCTPTAGQIERGIERELPGLVGPAESYEVNVEGVRDARFARRVTATGIRVEPEGSPVLDRVDVEMLDVAYNPRQGQLESVGRADVMIRILASDTATFLEQDRNVNQVSVEFEAPNQVVVQAEPQIPQLDLPPGIATVSARGALAGEGPLVNLNVTEVRAAGLALPSAAVRLISQELNPIVDLRGMPIALNVVDVRVEGNVVLVHVTGQYPPP